MNKQLAPLGERLHITLGGHENYDVTGTLSRNGSGALWLGSPLAPPLWSRARRYVLLAHEALWSRGWLIQRARRRSQLTPRRSGWRMQAVQQVHAARALSVREPTMETLCVAGHHRFRHSELAVFEGLVRQEILDGTAQLMRWPCSTWAATFRASRRQQWAERHCLRGATDRSAARTTPDDSDPPVRLARCHHSIASRPRFE
ncbi:hypothetical protein [Streptomyces sp. NPDC059788]|uniref:hypothetical protein n=1 Tax=Streptomyces sp. NPDC059788 TaxID=3346948 RepID=UPI0036553081